LTSLSKDQQFLSFLGYINGFSLMLNQFSKDKPKGNEFRQFMLYKLLKNVSEIVYGENINPYELAKLKDSYDSLKIHEHVTAMLDELLYKLKVNQNA
jgi:hypothetical protein